jgi:two-component system C4-dicarboxylate transport sensor histidine kinase DctB
MIHRYTLRYSVKKNRQSPNKLVSFIRWLFFESLFTDEERFIVHILLGGSVCLAGIALLTFTTLYFSLPDTYETPRAPIVILATIFSIFSTLFISSRFTKNKLVPYIFICLYLFSGLYTSYFFGIDVPQAMLIYALVIILAGIVLETFFAVVVTLLITFSLAIMVHLQKVGSIPLVPWSPESLHQADVIVYSITLAIITLVSCISNREITKSLRQARASEQALLKQRDLLEFTVEQRTQALKQAQLERMAQLYKFVEFGRVASGFFHDLSSPLTSVSLNLEQLQSRKIDTNQLNTSITFMKQGINQMQAYMVAARKQLQQQEEKYRFAVIPELKNVLTISKHKMIINGISLRTNFKQSNVLLYGNPLKFTQIMTNLISNAIDSYATIKNKKITKEIIVTMEKIGNKIVISVQDFGSGMDQQTLSHLFQPFFTTKNSSQGTGIGLYITKKMIEEDYQGTITVESQKNVGTLFTIRLTSKK